MSILEGTTLLSQLLKQILSRCDDNKGKYVTQGTYGIGLMFSISKFFSLTWICFSEYTFSA